MAKHYIIWSLKFGEDRTTVYTTYRKAQQAAKHRTVMTGAVWGIKEI